MTTERPLPRHTPVLVADPAPASGELAGPLIDKARRLEACNVADIDPAAAEVVALKCLAGLERELAYSDHLEARAEAAEAERDRLALELAAVAMLEAMLDWRDSAPGYGTGSMGILRREDGGRWEVYIQRSGTDLFTGEAQPTLSAAIHATHDALVAAGELPALATATPTPPAAEAGTGGGWTREAPDGRTLWGERWLVIHGNMTPSKCDVFPRDGVPRVLWGSGEYGIEVVKLWGPRVEPPDGWEAVLGQDQEVTDGAE